MLKKYAGKNKDKKLDVGMQKQIQFWNRDAKRSPKTTSPHIHFTYWPYQVGLMRVYYTTNIIENMSGVFFRYFGCILRV